MSAPIERTIRYSTTVANLLAAWQFVMGHMEEVGEDPSIAISPVWTGDDFEERLFEVAVEGTVET